MAHVNKPHTNYMTTQQNTIIKFDENHGIVKSATGAKLGILTRTRTKGQLAGRGFVWTFSVGAEDKITGSWQRVRAYVQGVR